MTKFCRHCNSTLNHEVIDLGHQPPSNAYLTKQDLQNHEITYPLKVFVCKSCWLVQIPSYTKPAELFTDDYAYFSSTSRSWSLHAKKFVYESIKKFKLNHKSNVLEIASNDGYLLKNFVDQKIPCLGIEPTKACAEASRKKGINTIEEFFTINFAKKMREERTFDLIIANNVLAHVPDVNNFMKAISIVLNQDGIVSIEFPHLLQLLKNNQFDTIYHEHYSYFSLKVVEKIAIQNGLCVVDVQELSTHGGSLRVFLKLFSKSFKSKNVEEVIRKENYFDLENIQSFDNFQNNSLKIKYNFLNYLLKRKDAKKLTVGYGAAAKGNTLINYAGVKSDLIDFVVDRAVSKQGKYLPGSHIPIVSEEKLTRNEINDLIVFPWNLIEELKIQLKNYELTTFIPNLKKW